MADVKPILLICIVVPRLDANLFCGVIAFENGNNRLHPRFHIAPVNSTSLRAVNDHANFMPKSMNASKCLIYNNNINISVPVKVKSVKRTDTWSDLAP
jgi:hypothetical protein